MVRSKVIGALHVLPPGRRMSVRSRSPDAVHIARAHDNKKCLRCKFIRLREKWSRHFMDGTEVMITEQPDPKKPWGIGCVVCSRYLALHPTKTKKGEGGGSAWATFSVGSGSAKSLGVEELLRHVGRASEKQPPDRFHVKAVDHFKNTRAADPDTEPLVQPIIGQVERDDVPTLSHMRICYSIVKRVTPPLGKTYEAECTRAREAGDAAATARRVGSTLQLRSRVATRRRFSSKTGSFCCRLRSPQLALRKTRGKDLS